MDGGQRNYRVDSRTWAESKKGKESVSTRSRLGGGINKLQRGSIPPKNRPAAGKQERRTLFKFGRGQAPGSERPGRRMSPDYRNATTVHPSRGTKKRREGDLAQGKNGAGLGVGRSVAVQRVEKMMGVGTEK